MGNSNFFHEIRKNKPLTKRQIEWLKKMKIEFELEENLEHISKNGILLYKDGYLSSPKEITKSCMVRENETYMADYILNEEGKLTEIRYDKINPEEI